MKTIYKIKFCKTPVSLYQIRSNENIISVKHKNSGYYNIVLETPTINYSLIKERQMNYTKALSAPKTEVKNLYLAKIDHKTNTIFVFKADGLYRFENNFMDLNKTTLTNNKIDFKMMSREELEHRRRNINYLMKRLEVEEENEKEYIRDDDIFSELQNEDEELENEIKESEKIHEKRKDFYSENNDKKDEITEFMIKKSIYSARIVNISELDKIFKRLDIIKKVLPEMCVKINGRFVLKNKFYAPSLRLLRKYILSQFAKNEIFVFQEHDETLKNQNIEFLLNEIAETQNNGHYILKGYYEDIQFEFKNSVDIKAIIKKHVVISMDKLKSILCLEIEEIEDILNSVRDDKERIVRLSNGTYVVDFISENKTISTRNSIIEFLKTKNNVKRNEILKFVYEKTGEELNLVLFNNVMKEFCNLKGSSWGIKSGN